MSRQKIDFRIISIFIYGCSSDSDYIESSITDQLNTLNPLSQLSKNITHSAFTNHQGSIYKENQPEVLNS